MTAFFTSIYFAFWHRLHWIDLCIIIPNAMNLIVQCYASFLMIRYKLWDHTFSLYIYYIWYQEATWCRVYTFMIPIICFVQVRQFYILVQIINKAYIKVPSFIYITNQHTIWQKHGFDWLDQRASWFIAWRLYFIHVDFHWWDLPHWLWRLKLH